MFLNILMLFKLFFFAPAPVEADAPKSIYDYTVPALQKGTIDFSKYKGRKILIVNVASECGNTPQYKELQNIYNKYKGKLVIVGFPANDFGGQEPGSPEQIAEFCKKEYAVTFPMAAKITTKGPQTAPIYQWLTQKKLNGVKDSEVKWNFQKYLIDEKGNLVEVFAPKTKPDAPEVIAAIEK